MSRSEFFIIFLLLFHFILFSFFKHKNIGIRYLLFFFPLLSILSGRLSTTKWIKQIWIKPFFALMLLLMVYRTISIWPNYLSFFNLAAGGSSGGPRYLLDSNIDWGQDLLLLKEYMDKNKIEKIGLSSFSRVNPSVYGINYEHYHLQPHKKQIIAISVNFLHGRVYFTNGVGYWVKAKDYYKFRKLTPIDRVGGSLYIYDLRD